MGYYLPIHGIYLDDILFTSHLPTSWNIQVVGGVCCRSGCYALVEGADEIHDTLATT